jgi:uncharacterized DUF497 family protein
MRIDAILWSAEIEEKLRSKHRVSVDEIDEILFESATGELTIRRGREDTYYVYGQTVVGRYLWVCIAASRSEPNAWSLVTARDMTESERRQYQEWISK